MFKWFLIYNLVCILFLCILKLKRKKWLAHYLIVSFFPVLGFLLIYLMDKKIKNDRQTTPDGLIEKGVDEGKVSLFREDLEKGRNVIPIEDALILNDNNIKRSVLLDLLKKESFQNIDAIKFALKNDDTETSHYAATAIMEIKRKLLNAMQLLEIQVDANPNDLQVLSTYKDVIKQYINSGYIDEKTLTKYKYAFSVILEKMIEIAPNEEAFYVEKISNDLSLTEYSIAREYSELFLKLHPHCEDAYFMDMQVHYLMKNAEEFEVSLNRLRNSTVSLSPIGLSKLRFWLQGEWNEY